MFCHADHSWRVYSFIELNRSFRCSCCSLVLVSKFSFLMVCFSTFWLGSVFWFFVYGFLLAWSFEQRVVDSKSSSDELHEYPFVCLFLFLFYFWMIRYDHYLCESTAMLIMNWNVNESNLHFFAVCSLPRDNYTINAMKTVQFWKRSNGYNCK